MSEDRLRALCRSARDEEGPQVGDRAAVRSGLAAKGLISAGVATAAVLHGTAAASTLAVSGSSAGAAGSAVTVSTVAPLTVGISSVAKLSVLAVAMAGVVGGGVLVSSKARAPTDVPARHSASHVAATQHVRTPVLAKRAPIDSPASPSLAIEEPAVEQKAQPVQPTAANPAPAHEAARPSAAPAAEPVPDLAQESSALAQVQQALRDGQPETALSLLLRQDRTFGRGALGTERSAARIFALCAAGRVGEAHARAVRFLSEHGSSPLSERVRATCNTEPESAPTVLHD